MDLERESSAHESVEDNESTTNQDSVSNINHNEVKFNGSSSKENYDVGTSRIVDCNTSSNDGEVEEGKTIDQVANSESPKSPSVGSPSTTKGYGLRKWRRIRRDVLNDESPNADSSKVLKRVLSVAKNASKPTSSMPVDITQNSNGSVGSINILRNVDAVEGLMIPGSYLESGFAVGSAFPAGEDSDNSEDQSSKSSTAASAPRLRYDVPTFLGHVREKQKVKNLSGKNAGILIQQGQQGQGRVENSKKARGERVKIEKENSHSSIESDSRSSNFVFMQGASSLAVNGNQGERSMYYDGENSDAHNAGEQRFGEGQENAGIDENVPQDDLAGDASWEGKEDKSNNHRSSTDQDPLVESILTLQSLQEALESEVKNFGQIGKGSSTTADTTFAHRGVDEPSSSEQFDSEKIRQLNSFESQVSSLTENIKDLKSKMEELEAMIKVKESRIAELENSLISGKSTRQESGNFVELDQEKFREVETELESIFKQRLEAELEYLTLTKTIQKLKLAAGDQKTLFEHQETLAGEQAQMLNKLGEAEKKAIKLSKQAEELEKYRRDILETEEVLQVHRRVCKVTSYFFVQLVLLTLVLLLLVSQISPLSGVNVPT